MGDFIDHIRTDRFTAYTVENHTGTMKYEGREGYCKVALICGIGEINYNHHVYKIKSSVLLLAKPGINCTWSLTSMTSASYVCTFKDDLLKTGYLSWLKECEHYFSLNPVFILKPEEEKFVRSIFCRMIDEQKAGYLFKEELVQNQICVLAHLALRMVPAENVIDLSSSALPSTVVLLELVELQFPTTAQVVHLN